MSSTEICIQQWLYFVDIWSKNKLFFNRINWELLQVQTKSETAGVLLI